MRYYNSKHYAEETTKLIAASIAAMNPASTNRDWWRFFFIAGFTDYEDTEHYLRWGSAKYIGLQYGDHGMPVEVRQPDRTFILKVLWRLWTDTTDQDASHALLKGIEKISVSD